MIAIAHTVAWCNHDWDKTKEMLAPNVHAVVTNTEADFLAEFTGIDNYMALKIKAAQLIQPGSLEVLSAIGDENTALIMITFRIGMGPGGAMATMARSGLYWLDKRKKIKEERDSFFLLSQ